MREHNLPLGESEINLWTKVEQSSGYSKWRNYETQSHSLILFAFLFALPIYNMFFSNVPPFLSIFVLSSKVG